MNEKTEIKNGIKPLVTMNGTTLMQTPFEPLAFAIDKILPHGVFILAGSGKIGKSWLALDMCVAVSTGSSLWEFNALEGDILYLALEDTYPRLQSRLAYVGEDNTNISKLHLATASLGIGDGLIEQIGDFLEQYPNTKLVVIDTLERIRNEENDKSMYSCDYRDMTKLREITNSHAITLLLVHHTRKMFDPDPLNTLSGSTGLVGSVDGVWVLEKEKRTGTKGKLTIANRDTEGFCFKLDFNSENCKWSFISNNEDEEDIDDNLCQLIQQFVKNDFKGTATQLCEGLEKLKGDCDISSRTITKRLNGIKKQLQATYKIEYLYERNKNSRTIILHKIS